jgi:hypothetical protein
MTEYRFLKLTQQGTHRKSTMTAEIACQIVQDRHDGMTIKDIAIKHGRSFDCVAKIASGYTWVKETLELRVKLAKLKKELQS